MGIDHYRQTYHDLGNRPKKALFGRLGKSFLASKMDADIRTGAAIHCGYGISELWGTSNGVSSLGKLQREDEMHEK